MMGSEDLMIVRTNGPSLLLITQPDHAALAGRVMREWGAGGLLDSPRRADILRAIDHHDNGWHEVDRSPLIDESTGRILDFVSAPDPLRQAVWPRGIARLVDTPYSAALVAQHAIHVYSRYRQRPEWSAFFADMEARRDEHLAQAHDASLDELLRDYQAVRLGDLISLVFCNGWADPQREGKYQIRLDRDRVLVTPDPFGGRSIDIEVEGRELPDRPFASVADAQRAFDAAAPRRLPGSVRGTGPIPDQ
jgi:hypothetical protein